MILSKEEMCFTKYSVFRVKKYYDKHKISQKVFNEKEKCLIMLF